MPVSRRPRRRTRSQRPVMVAGRLAYLQFVQTLASLAQFDQADRRERWEKRVRLEALGQRSNGVTVWREYWPEPAPIPHGYNHERLAQTEALRASGISGKLARLKSRLFN